jgi:hypothetical protein
MLSECKCVSIQNNSNKNKCEDFLKTVLALFISEVVEGYCKFKYISSFLLFFVYTVYVQHAGTDSYKFSIYNVNYYVYSATFFGH